MVPKQNTDQPQPLEVLSHLPALSGIALAILQLPDDAGTKDYLACIAQDPALSARVIRIANCSTLKEVESVSDLEGALEIIGNDSMQLLTLSIAIGGACLGKQPKCEEGSQLVAAASRQLIEAKRTGNRIVRVDPRMAA